MVAVAREWRNGRRSRLKIDRRKSCGFESLLSHQWPASADRAMIRRPYAAEIFQHQIKLPHAHLQDLLAVQEFALGQELYDFAWAHAKNAIEENATQ